MLTEVPMLTSLVHLRVVYFSRNQLYLGEEEQSSASLPSGQTDIDGLPEEGLAVGGSAAVSAGTSSEGGGGISEQRHKTSPPPLRDRLGDVQVLSLANNGLRSAAIVANISSLQHLDLSGNKIESVGWQ